MASVVVIRDALHTAGAVVSAEEARVSQSAGWARSTTGLGARTGIVYQGVSTLLASTATTAPSMTVTVAPLHYVGQKAVGEGVYVGGSSSTVTVDVAAAPGSNSRIDVVYVMQRDSGSTTSPDASIQGEIGVITGTAGVTPAKPAIPVGAVEVGTVTVPAGATATTGCTIATTCQWTAPIGSPLPVRNQTERDALTAYNGLQVYRLDLKSVESYGTTWTGASSPDTMRIYNPTTISGFGAGVYTGMSWSTNTTTGDATAYSISGGSLTLNKSGWYMVTGNITGASGSAVLEAKIATSGGKILCRATGPASDTVISMAASYYLTAGTILGLSLYNFSGSVNIPADADASPNYWTVTRFAGT